MMKAPLLCITTLLIALCHGDVVEEFVEEMKDSNEEIVSSGQSPDGYDRPYSLNPVPINPNAPEPTTWRDAYGRLCKRIDSLQSEVSLLKQRVSELEEAGSSPTSETPAPLKP